jgi:hypothetical protein
VIPRALLLLVFAATGAVAQEAAMAVVVENAREAWLAQDMEALLASPDPVIIGLPGAEPALPLPPRQAAALLEDFLELTDETEFSFRAVRETSADQGYAEAIRIFVVRGTAEPRRQRVLMGFRRIRRDWRLYEIRIYPITTPGG